MALTLKHSENICMKNKKMVLAINGSILIAKAKVATSNDIGPSDFDKAKTPMCSGTKELFKNKLKIIKTLQQRHFCELCKQNKIHL